MSLKGKKHPTYISPPSSRGSRWNWHKSEPIKFPTGERLMAHRHPNGGGWVADDSYVALSVYVDPCGCVYKGATVLAGSRIGKWTAIKDEVLLFGNPNFLPGGQHLVEEKSIIFGSPVYKNGANTQTSGKKLSGRVFGQVEILTDVKITDDSDVFGSYKVDTGSYQDIEFPNPHQGHKNYDPISKSSPLKLQAETQTLPPLDWSDITAKNGRDGFSCGSSSGPSDGGSDPGYYAEGGENTVEECESDASGLNPFVEPGCSLPDTISLDGLEGPTLAAAAAWNAGFRGESLGMAVAIAGGESSYNPGAVGDVSLMNDKWGPSVGLWQVRTLNDPSQWGGVDRGRDISILTNNPQEQANMAFAISRGGTKWTDWSVYTSGSYCGYIDAANSGISSLCGL